MRRGHGHPINQIARSRPGRTRGHGDEQRQRQRGDRIVRYGDQRPGLGKARFERRNQLLIKLVRCFRIESVLAAAQVFDHPIAQAIDGSFHGSGSKSRKENEE